MSGDSPFVGNNLLLLSEATLCRMVEVYLNEKLLFQGNVKVSGIKQVHGVQYEGFKIRLAPEEEPKGGMQ